MWFNAFLAFIRYKHTEENNNNSYTIIKQKTKTNKDKANRINNDNKVIKIHNLIANVSHYCSFFFILILFDLNMY